MQPDDLLNKLPVYWPDEPVPAGLAERIMLNARHMPQHKSWWKNFSDVLGTWNSGWEIKGPAFAAVLILGLVSGQLSGFRSTNSTTHFSWTEEL